MIGVSGVNHYAETAGQLFSTQDRDLFLGGAVVEREALVRAVSPRLTVDLTLVMAGFSFPVVWPSRRVATHEEALRHLLERGRRSR